MSIQISRHYEHTRAPQSTADSPIEDKFERFKTARNRGMDDSHINPERRAHMATVEDEPEVSTFPLQHFSPGLSRCSQRSFSSRDSNERPLIAAMDRMDTDSCVLKIRTKIWAFPMPTFVSTVLDLCVFHKLTRTEDDGNYNIPTGGANQEKASAVLAQFERKRFAQTIAVPTDDNKVRLRLREHGEPITLFGEGPAERRDRLRELLTRLAEGGGDVAASEDVDMEEGGELQEEYYTEGTAELLKARQDIARYSLPKAQKRIVFQKAEAKIPGATHVKHRKAIVEHLQGFELYGSQIASDRPIAGIRFSPNNEYIASGSWTGTIKIMDIPNLETKYTLRGHKELVSGLSWMPGATLPGSKVSPATVNLASGGGEGDVHLWSLKQDTPITTLSGHEGRVSRVEFHPSGKFLASASHDMTWRLWDIETSTELLMQEGHSREVHSVAFNLDGSLVASAGHDSIGRIWDLRTGRMVMYLDSHILPILALDWGTDGYRVLTGSSDGFVKCWDVRMVKETAIIGAHTGGVTDLTWFKGTDGPLNVSLPAKDEQGDYIPKRASTFVVTAGFDKSIKIFSADDWAPCKTLTAHSGNVTGVDVTTDSKWIASCGRDRTVKLWQRDDGQGI